MVDSLTRDFTRREAAVISAARTIADGEAVFIGQGLPVIAALFAKRTHAKNSVIMHEYGVVDTDPPFALELAHPIFADNALYLSDMIDALGCLVLESDVAILGTAQIDRYGNMNTTSIGNYLSPKLRISGSGGANDIGSLASKLVVIMDNQQANKFVERVDYVTTPGFFRGGMKTREKLFLLGSGPSIVVTDLGVYRFSRATGEMYLEALQHGVTLEEVRRNTGWKINVARPLRTCERPTEDEVRLLRALDPQKVYLRA